MSNRGGTGNSAGETRRKSQKDLEVSGMEKVLSDEKGITTYGETKVDTKPADYNPEKDDTAAKTDMFINYQETQPGKGNIVTKSLDTVFDAGSKVTREYFVGEVLGKGAYKDTTAKDFERKSLTEQNKIYKDYINKRSSGETDAYGRKLDNQKSNEQPRAAAQMDNTNVKSTNIVADQLSPTTVEIGSEKSIAKNYEEEALRTKKKGRNVTVLTSVTGDTSKPTLSKRRLLG